MLAEKKGEKGKYIVLDGKQRLLALLQFTGNAVDKDENNNFKLGGLDVLEDLKGMTYAQMDGNFIAQGQVDALLNQTIRTVVIRNWSSRAFLHLVFLRLNTSSVPLSPQELRQALIPGEFVNFADDRSAESEPLRKLLGNKGPDYRMRDVELLVRYLGFQCFLPEYAGNLSAFLDITCERLNDTWGGVENSIITLCNEFDAAIKAGEEIFGEGHVGRKWTEQNFEKRLNRAVLDVITFYFSDPTIREAAFS